MSSLNDQVDYLINSLETELKNNLPNKHKIKSSLEELLLIKRLAQTNKHKLTDPVIVDMVKDAIEDAIEISVSTIFLELFNR